MSSRAPTDQEIEQMWIEECARARKLIAERRRVHDAMRQAGLTRESRPVRVGATS